MRNINTIWVCGLGGVGGYFGARIAHQISSGKKGRKVYFIARGEHLKAIQKEGLCLQSNGETVVARPTGAAAEPGDWFTPDLCLLAVKSYDLEEAVKRLAPHIRQDTIVLPLLNGLDIYLRVRVGLPDRGMVMPSCIYITSSIERPGKVVHNGPPGRIVCGHEPFYPKFDPKQLLALAEEMDLDIDWLEDPLPAIWKKYLMMGPLALVTAARGKSFGEVLGDAGDRGKVAAIMAEVIAIGKKQGIPLALSLIDETLEMAGRFPYEARSSFQRDLEQGREKMERDVFLDTIPRLSRETGVATPVADEMAALVKGQFALV